MPNLIDPVGTNALISAMITEEGLPEHPEYQWDMTANALVCPDGRHLRLVSVQTKTSTSGRGRVLFANKCGQCVTCKVQSSCFPTASETKRKLIGVTCDLSCALALSESLRLERQRTPMKQPESGKNQIQSPLFLPAAARKLLAKQTRALTFWVTLERPTKAKPTPVLFADSDGTRQHRRLTWERSFERYALEARALLAVQVNGGAAVKRRMNVVRAKAAA